MTDENLLFKLRKIIGQTLAEELDALSRDDLQQRIVSSEQNVADSEAAMAADEQLSAAKAQVKELAAPYRDAIKYQRAAQRYAYHQLRSKG